MGTCLLGLLPDYLQGVDEAFSNAGITVMPDRRQLHLCFIFSFFSSSFPYLPPPLTSLQPSSSFLCFFSSYFSTFSS